MDNPTSNPNLSEVSPDEKPPVEPLESKLAALTAEIDKLAAEKCDLQDRILRNRAEFDNVRRRAEKERSDYIQFANMDLVKQLLPIVDDFERAVKAPSTDKDYARGVELIYQRVLDTLKKIGLEPIVTEGEHFDPNIHEAVQRVETDESEDQAILEEFQRGYNFKGKLLRPAWVKVAVRP